MLCDSLAKRFVNPGLPPVAGHGERWPGRTSPASRPRCERAPLSLVEELARVMARLFAEGVTGIAMQKLQDGMVRMWADVTPAFDERSIR